MTPAYWQRQTRFAKSIDFFKDLVRNVNIKITLKNAKFCK